MMGQWELNGIYHADGSFMGFWAIPLDQLEVGNIRRMWFELNDQGEWEAFAFEPVNALTQAANLHLQGMSEDSLTFFKYREELANNKFVDEDINGGAEGLLTKGFITGDPLTDAAATMQDPTPMIDLLADVSYPIAPGMTSMMVAGTGGTNVNMSHETKAILDCLRSTGGIACGECVCDTENNSATGEWTVAQSTDFGGLVFCDYTRVIVHSYWQVGLYPDGCDDCTIGTEDEPAVYTQVETVQVLLVDGGICPAQP